MASSVTPIRWIGVERSSATIVSKTVASFSQVIVGSTSRVGAHRNLHVVCENAGAAANSRHETKRRTRVNGYCTLHGDTPVQFLNCAFAQSFVCVV